MHPSLSDLLGISSSLSSTVSSQQAPVEPFLKWPGGKRWLAKKVARFIAPRLQGRYFEPFLGGGAVFFALQPETAILSDINADLINVYVQVQQNYELIQQRLQTLPVSHDDYYRIRKEEPEDRLERAVRFLYLNRTAFGGMYRVNQEGKFNVPYGGGQRTPEILWRDGLLKSASAALQGVSFEVSDFESVIDQAGSGDVVYCDPTYTVVHETNNFIRYNESNFSWADQQRLAEAAKRAYNRGVLVLVSNASHSSLTELYSPFEPIRIARKSRVSRKIESRRLVNEFLFVLDPGEA